MQVKKIPDQYRHSGLEPMFQYPKKLLEKFYYKIKQRTPPPPVFVKVVEIKQKSQIFQCFTPWFTLLIFQPFYVTDLREISVVSFK